MRLNETQSGQSINYSFQPIAFRKKRVLSVYFRVRAELSKAKIGGYETFFWQPKKAFTSKHMRPSSRE